MSIFDSRARNWDKEKIHMERSFAIATEIEKIVPIKHDMKALEYGAGTGILSFLLKDKFSNITLMDNSQEMINVCCEKVEYHAANHIKPVFFDLEHNKYNENFDFIYNQMVLHHVSDYETILETFYNMLHTEGFIAIADLYTEDGSFHGLDVNVHHGFNPDALSEKLKTIGFKNVEYKTCFEIKRDNGFVFPIFLIVGQK